MKPLFISLLILVTTSTFSQKSKNQEPILFIGIDYSLVRLIGAQGFTNPPQIRDYYFNAWNTMLITEKSKYDIGSYFKKNVDYELNAVETGNKNTPIDQLVIYNNYTLSQDDLVNAVKKYDIKGNYNIGLVFIAESLNHSQFIATYYVTFFNIKTREILVTTPLSGRPGGLGFRNFWMGSIKKMLDKVPSNRKNWEKYLQV